MFYVQINISMSYLVNNFQLDFTITTYICNNTSASQLVEVHELLTTYYNNSIFVHLQVLLFYQFVVDQMQITYWFKLKTVEFIIVDTVCIVDVLLNLRTLFDYYQAMELKELIYHNIYCCYCCYLYVTYISSIVITYFYAENKSNKQKGYTLNLFNFCQKNHFIHYFVKNRLNF